MPAWTGAGGVWKALPDLYSGAGGAHKRITGGWVGAGGVWRPCYGYIATLTPGSFAGNTGFGSSPAVYGTLSNVTPVTGLTIIQLHQSSSGAAVLRFNRATAPGPAFFTQMTVGGVVLNFASAGYIYTGPEGQWTWAATPLGLSVGVPVTVTIY